jgi:hypothetical protein
MYFVIKPDRRAGRYMGKGLIHTLIHILRKATMARKKRQRPTEVTGSAGDATTARQAVKELRNYYQLGLEVLDADRKNPNKRTYSKHVSQDFADRLGVGRDYVDKARQFASSYTEAQLEELCSLRRPDGLPLGRRHAVALLSVKDKRQRRSLQRRAAEEGWGTRRLGEEITVLQGSGSSGGRRPRGPDSVEDAVAQVIKMCERWGRWYEGFDITADEDSISLKDLPKPVREALMRATAEIKTLASKADRNLKRLRSGPTEG